MGEAAGPPILTAILSQDLPETTKILPWAHTYVIRHQKLVNKWNSCCQLRAGVYARFHLPKQRSILTLQRLTNTSPFSLHSVCTSQKDSPNFLFWKYQPCIPPPLSPLNWHSPSGQGVHSHLLKSCYSYECWDRRRLRRKTGRAVQLLPPPLFVTGHLVLRGHDLNLINTHVSSPQLSSPASPSVLADQPRLAEGEGNA